MSAHVIVTHAIVVHAIVVHAIVIHDIIAHATVMHAISTHVIVMHAITCLRLASSYHVVAAQIREVVQQKRLCDSRCVNDFVVLVDFPVISIEAIEMVSMKMGQEVEKLQFTWY